MNWFWIKFHQSKTSDKMTKYKDEKKKKRIKRKEKNWDKESKMRKERFYRTVSNTITHCFSYFPSKNKKKNGRYFRIIGATEKWNRMKKYKILRNIKFSFFKIFFIYICIKIPLLIKKRIHFLLSFLPKDNFQ